MNTRPLFMVAIAVVFGAIAIFVADIWLSGEPQASTPPQKVKVIREKEVVQYNTIVVASTKLRYGDKITADALKEISWSQKEIPEGAYRKIDEAVKDGKRVVLQPMDVNEPLLLSKLSGKDGRASLANTLSEGMRAVSIPVDEISGVAGFISPGDRVDIVLIRSGETMTANLVLQNVRVLTVDQAADVLKTGPKVAKAVTVEVDGKGARKLALAMATGKLSLTLRAAGDQSVEATKIAKSDESDGLFSKNIPRKKTVIVTRGLQPTHYSVDNETYIEKHGATGQQAASQ